jgi:hypothetical protein
VRVATAVRNDPRLKFECQNLFEPRRMASVVQTSPLALVHLSALLLDAFRRQSRGLFETGHQPRWFERQARYDGPRPFDIGPFPICGPRRWAISDGEQVLVLSASLITDAPSLLCDASAICLSLRTCFGRFLSSVTSATSEAAVGPKRSAISASVTP